MSRMWISRILILRHEICHRRTEFYVQAASVFGPEARKLLAQSLAIGLSVIARIDIRCCSSPSDNQALSMLVTPWVFLHTCKGRDTLNLNASTPETLRTCTI